MILNLTDISSEPLQQQIIRQIRSKILAGDLKGGESIPSIRVLARENHISVITVTRAYEILEIEGLIHSRRSKGFFVSEILDERKKKMAQERLIEYLAPLIKNALAEGLATDDIKNAVENILEKAQ